MDVPSNTIEFLTVIKQQYEDKLEVDERVVGTPEYWKRVGVVELIRTVEAYVRRKDSNV